MFENEPLDSVLLDEAQHWLEVYAELLRTLNELPEVEGDAEWVERRRQHLRVLQARYIFWQVRTMKLAAERERRTAGRPRRRGSATAN